MMDSQENTLEVGKNEELNVVENTVETTETTVVQDEAPQVENENKADDTATDATPEAQEESTKKVYTSKQEVLDRVKEIAHSDETPKKMKWTR